MFSYRLLHKGVPLLANQQRLTYISSVCRHWMQSRRPAWRDGR